MAPSPAQIHDLYVRIFERTIAAPLLSLTAQGQQAALALFDEEHSAEVARLAAAADAETS